MTINEAEKTIIKMKLKGWNSGWQNKFLSLKKEYDDNQLLETELELKAMIVKYI